MKKTSKPVPPQPQRRSRPHQPFDFWDTRFSLYPTSVDFAELRELADRLCFPPPRSGPPASVRSIARILRQLTSDLEQHVGRGEPSAVRLLAMTVVELSVLLAHTTGQAALRPFLREVARQTAVWPVLRSRLYHFDQHHTALTPQDKALFRSLEVGSAYPVKGQRFLQSPDRLAAFLAELLGTVQGAKRGAVIRVSGIESGTIPAWEMAAWGLPPLEVPRRAGKPTALNKPAWEQWWEVMQQKWRELCPTNRQLKQHWESLGMAVPASKSMGGNLGTAASHIFASAKRKFKGIVGLLAQANPNRSLSKQRARKSGSGDSKPSWDREAFKEKMRKKGVLRP